MHGVRRSVQKRKLKTFEPTCPMHVLWIDGNVPPRFIDPIHLLFTHRPYVLGNIKPNRKETSYFGLGLIVSFSLSSHPSI